jgi:1-aminocyclopropane-1-carboxylate deaminase/D-cysteine desulfhydrase-like pyridoxal-dependent ACC family enzyme
MLWPWHIPTAIAQDATTAAAFMGLPHQILASEVDADENFLGPGYAKHSEAGGEALTLFASTEAILLDHVYTAKAMAALMADVRAGHYPPGSVIVFIHTGGIPAIFAEPEQLLPEYKTNL